MPPKRRRNEEENDEENRGRTTRNSTRRNQNKRQKNDDDSSGSSSSSSSEDESSPFVVSDDSSSNDDSLSSLSGSDGSDSSDEEEQEPINLRELLLNGGDLPSEDSEDDDFSPKEGDNDSSSSSSENEDDWIVPDDEINGLKEDQNRPPIPPDLGRMIIIPLGRLFGPNPFGPPKPSGDDDDDGPFTRNRSGPPFTNLRKRPRQGGNNRKSPPKKRVKTTKVNILDKIRTLDDMLAAIDKYEDKPELEYTIDMSKFKALKEPLLELKNLVGLNQIKAQILDQVMYLLSNLQDNDQMLHTVLTGAPGCGKTTLGLILAGIYKALGYSNGKFRIAKRADLVAGYLGQTTLKTQKVINETRGGVLFIDEAYSLGNAEGRDSFAKEAIDCINQNLTEMKTEIICIIAGYKKQLEECFFSYNPGLSRRFPFRYDVGDYNDRDLYQIFLRKIEQSGWTMEAIPVSFFSENFKYFTNKGGDMETLSQMCKITYCRRTFGRHQDRHKHLLMEDVDEGIKLFLRKLNRKRSIPPLEHNPEGESIDVLDEITTLDELLTAIDKYDADPKYNYPFDIHKFKALKMPLTALKNMVGLEDIKSQVLVQIMFLLSRLQDDDMMLHTVICGDPGTGKTMLAKILADIYQCLGYSNGNFKVAKGSDLVAGYVGQTALKTQTLIDEAKGGVLFIDEAYSMGSNKDTGSFAKEALDTLNQNLSELKTDLICIIAGYKDKLESCFFAYNPGLSRRFPFRYEIKNYDSENLKSIFYSKVSGSGWTVDEIPSKFFKEHFSEFPNLGGDMETLSQMCKIIYAKRTFGKHQERERHLTYGDLKLAFKLFKKGNLSEKDNHERFFKEYIQPTMYL